MRAEAREKRKQAIETAAIELLIEAGYDGLSMLSVARRAKASNETLYRWYGDKTGLFSALVARNAAMIRDHLETSAATSPSPAAALQRFGPHLLTVLTGPAAIALNRAAAADTTGDLGAALASAGREAILPVLRPLVSAAQANGVLPGISLDEAVELYVSLLLGDLQIRLVTRARPPLSHSEIRSRAENAWSRVEALSRGQSPASP